jgi:hypothetical protein
MKALLSCTGPLTVVGVGVLTYGILSGSPLFFIQGLSLSYMGIHMSFSALESSSQEE